LLGRKEREGSGYEEEDMVQERTGLEMVHERESKRKVDIKLPGKGNSNSHGARPVLLIITLIA
jgi:hypothetical protein